ncbi:MAG: transcriptional repressor [Beijerinckiaceae bacterium]
MASHDHTHHRHAHPNLTCTHAHDRAHNAAELLHGAEAACQARGARLTDLRKQVLAALLATHKPMGAYDLIEALAAEGQKPLAPVSIYRALDFLVEQGFVHRLASRNAFVACPHAHAPGDMVVFLICDQCGGVDEAVSDDLSRSLSRLIAKEGFQSRTQVIELSGACAHCRPASGTHTHGG